MKKLGFLLTTALALVLVGGAHPSYAQGSQTLTVQLATQNNSGESGTATLTAMGDQTMVSLNLTGFGADAQPAHIHPGSCATLDPKPAYPLTSAVDGKSETTVPATFAEITSGKFAINIHKSAKEAAVYVACGDIVLQALGGAAGGGAAGGTSGGTGNPDEYGTTGAAVPGMPTTGNGDQTLPLALALFASLLAGTGLVLSRRRV